MRARLGRGELDLVLCAMYGAVDAGEKIGVETVGWAVAQDSLVHEAAEVPLALYEEGCMTRANALRALDKAGKPYRIAYTSPSINGVQALVASGLAVAPMRRTSLPPGARLLGPGEGFPELPSASIVLLRAAGRPSEATQALARFIADDFRESPETALR